MDSEKSTNIFEVKKRGMRIGICTLFLHQFYLCQVKFFIKHYLILSMILYKGSMLINVGFLIKEDFRYVV